MLARADFDPAKSAPAEFKSLAADGYRDLARVITVLENGALDEHRRDELHALAHRHGAVPVLGVTGTEGAGKSSLTDEIILRFRMYGDEPKIAVIAIDPTRRERWRLAWRPDPDERHQCAQRLHALARKPVQRIMRFRPHFPISLQRPRPPGFDLIMIETPGIGQGDAGIVPHVDVALYVMTPESSAPPASSKRSICWILPTSLR